MALNAACFATIALAMAHFASAQSVAVHPDYATGTAPRYVTPGNLSQSGFPFSAGLSRQLVVFGVSELRLPQGARVDAIGFPREEGQTTSAQTVDIRVRMGAAALPFDQASTLFDANWHGVPDEVFASRPLALPVLSASQELVWVPFDHPYVFDRSRDLALESVVTANGARGLPFAYPLAAFPNARSFVAIGSACPTSGGWVPGLNGSISPVTGLLDYGVFRSVADTGVVFLFSLSRRTTPLDLARFGAPACLLYVDPLVTTNGRTRTDGVYWSSADVAGLRAYTNRIYLQAAIADYFANSLGIITTLVHEVRFRAAPFATLILGQGDPNANSGMGISGWGGVVLFRH